MYQNFKENLVSRSVLNKFGFKVVFEPNKFILSKGAPLKIRVKMVEYKSKF